MVLRKQLLGLNLETALPFNISSSNGYSLLDIHVNLIKLIKKATNCTSRVVDGHNSYKVPEAEAFVNDKENITCNLEV